MKNKNTLHECLNTLHGRVVFNCDVLRACVRALLCMCAPVRSRVVNVCGSVSNVTGFDSSEKNIVLSGWYFLCS